MRHAVIRRHQSMYVHSRATSESMAGATTGGSSPSAATAAPPFRPYRMQEASGKSEVRPIVTLQRSKTTAASLHYR